MGMNDVSFNLGSNGLGRQSPNEDHISGLIFSQAQPVSWGTSKIKSFRSIEQLESNDIVETDPTFGLVHYTAKEFFRMNPSGLLYLIFNDASVSEIVTASAGKIRQYGVFGTVSLISVLQTRMEELRALHAPAVCILGVTGITDVLDALQTPDLHLQSNNLVAAIIAGDGDADGKALATALGLDYIAALGAVLGAISRARVSDSVAWVEQFNFAVSNGELDQILLADGTDYNAMLPADLDALHDKGYLFFRRFVGLSGSYLNDTFTAVDLESDYANIQLNRAIQKAERLLYSVLLPKLNSPLLVDATSGKLSIDTIKYFEGICDKTTRENMLNKSELSGFSVFIDPDQNILQTSTLQVSVKLVPVGTASEISVLLGFAVSVG